MAKPKTASLKPSRRVTSRGSSMGQHDTPEAVRGLRCPWPQSLDQSGKDKYSLLREKPYLLQGPDHGAPGACATGSVSSAGTPVTFELIEGGAMLRKGVADDHPVDRVFGRVRLGQAGRIASSTTCAGRVRGANARADEDRGRYVGPDRRPCRRCQVRRGARGPRCATPTTVARSSSATSSGPRSAPRSTMTRRSRA